MLSICKDFGAQVSKFGWRYHDGEIKFKELSMNYFLWWKQTGTESFIETCE